VDTQDELLDNGVFVHIK